MIDSIVERSFDERTGVYLHRGRQWADVRLSPYVQRWLLEKYERQINAYRFFRARSWSELDLAIAGGIVRISQRRRIAIFVRYLRKTHKLPLRIPTPPCPECGEIIAVERGRRLGHYAPNDLRIEVFNPASIRRAVIVCSGSYKEV